MKKSATTSVGSESALNKLMRLVYQGNSLIMPDFSWLAPASVSHTFRSESDKLVSHSLEGFQQQTFYSVSS